MCLEDAQWQVRKAAIDALAKVAEERAPEVLGCGACPKLTDAGVEAVARCPLRSVDVGSCAGLTDRGVRALAQCGTLEARAQKLLRHATALYCYTEAHYC